MTARRALMALGLLLATAVSAAALTAEKIDDSPFHAPPDVDDFILKIAGPTATAQIRGDDGTFRKVVTLGRNAKGELVVTSIQVVASAQAPQFDDGTVAVLIVHHAGECQPPYGEDYRPLFKRIFTFIVDHSGKTVWELGYLGGTGSFRLVKGANDFGPEETFNVDPSHYKTYACANYD